MRRVDARLATISLVIALALSPCSRAQSNAVSGTAKQAPLIVFEQEKNEGSRQKPELSFFEFIMALDKEAQPLKNAQTQVQREDLQTAINRKANAILEQRTRSAR